MLNDAYEYYRTKSKGELWQVLLEMTAEQKRRGELNEAQMEETYRALAPFLSSQQKAQLRSLLDSLK